MSSNQFFNVFGWPLLGFLGCPWASFGSSWGHLRLCWALPGAISWPAWGAVGLLGRPWASLGFSWGHLRDSWALTGAISLPSSSMLACVGKLFGHPWGLLEAVLGQLWGWLGGPGVLLGRPRALGPPGSWGSCVVEEWRRTYNCFNIDGAEHRRLK